MKGYFCQTDINQLNVPQVTRKMHANLPTSPIGGSLGLFGFSIIARYSNGSSNILEHFPSNYHEMNKRMKKLYLVSDRIQSLPRPLKILIRTRIE